MIIDSLANGLGWSLLKNVNKVHPLIVFSVFLVSAFAYRAWRSRIRGGDYEFNTKDGDFSFESELGTFTFNKDKKSFVANYGKTRQVALSFADIRNIELITEDVDAMLSEIAFEEFDPFINTLQEYRDVYTKHTIAVVTQNYQRYPLIVVSQYTVKQFFTMAYSIQMQLDLLSLIGLYVPIETYMQEIYVGFKRTLSQEFAFDRDKL